MNIRIHNTKKLVAFSTEVVQSSGHLDDIERNIGIINESVHKISEGTEEQKRDAEQVFLRTNEMIEKFEQLMEQSGKLMVDAEYSIESGRNGIENVEKLSKCNEVTIKKMESTYEKIMNLEEQSKKVSEIVNTITGIKFSKKYDILNKNKILFLSEHTDCGNEFSGIPRYIFTIFTDTTTAILMNLILRQKNVKIWQWRI